MGRQHRVTIEDPDGSVTDVAYEYDAGGARTKQTVDDGTTVRTTEFLTDHRNATGYSQTLVETVTVDAIEVKRTSYVLGHDQITQTVTEAGVTATHTFHADGHGSVRVLTDAAAAVLQTYVYDAYGLLLNIEAEAALTSYLYSGEAFDTTIGRQNLRARWYNPQTGGFNRLDPFFGNHSDPQSFHKYLYTHADPVNGVDPSGLFKLTTAIATTTVISTLVTLHVTYTLLKTFEPLKQHGELDRLAKRLETKVVSKAEFAVRERRWRDGKSRKFVHGTVFSPGWSGSSKIRGDVGDVGDFGIGFYTFPRSVLGVTRSSQWAVRRSKSTGDLAFLLLVSIDEGQYQSLEKDNYTRPPLYAQWEDHVNEYRAGLRDADSGKDLVLGRVADQGAGGRWVTHKDPFPTQYKYEHRAVPFLRIDGIVPLGWGYQTV